MELQAEISVYPLRIKSLSEPINEFCSIIADYGLKMKTTSMSTIISGQSDDLFKALENAFGQLSKKYQIVMNIKISNACSIEE